MGKGLVMASLTSLSEGLCRDLTMCLCVWSLGCLAEAGPGCALPWVVGRGRQDQDPSDTPMVLHRRRSPLASILTVLSVSGVGGPIWP